MVGVDNGDYAIVVYDDGVFACIKRTLIRWRKGQYSAKWKNAYYNVQVVRSGTQKECDLYMEKHSSISEELQDCPESNQHEDSQKETHNSGKSNDKGVDNEDYAVVLYDDGVFACIKKTLIQWREGQYSAKWKNAYYNVQVRRSGTQKECDLYIEQHTSISGELQDSVECNQHEDLQEKDNNSTSDDTDRHASISEELQDSVECNQHEDLQERDINSTSDEREPYGSDFSDNDPTFIPYSEDSESEPLGNTDDGLIIRNNNFHNEGPQGIKACNSRTLPERENELFSRYQCEESEESGKSTTYDGVPKLRRGTNKFVCKAGSTTKRKKLNFCIYCKALFTQLPRHLEKKHEDEQEVKQILALPKNSIERKKNLDRLRKRGNFLHNGDAFFNTGILITSRRVGVGKENTAYVPCPTCLGYYSKNCLRKHFRMCDKSSGGRTILQSARKVEGDVGREANDIVRNFIFPILRDDDFTRPLRYDDLVIIYANKMTIKYPKSHNYPMIRSRMRLIGKILHQVKQIDNTVTDFASILLPKKYDAVVSAIKIIAQLDPKTNHYKAPSTASAAGTLLKKCANIYITELIKKENNDLKCKVEDFLKVLDVDFGITINKGVLETQNKNKRKRKHVLPSMEDIQSLNSYLKQSRSKHFESLKKQFNIQDYIDLQKTTLTSVQIFNRKRAGEVQRIEVEDFINHESYNNNRDQHIVDDFPEDWKKDALNFIRFTIRGKLGREVPILLYKELIVVMEYLIKNREKVGILRENPYIFGIPNTKDKCLDACALMRQFSSMCHAKNPQTLRGTILRKDLATKSMVKGDIPVNDIADFMGHDPKIHVDHYRLPRATRDLTRVSRMLMIGNGIEVDAVGDENNTVLEDSNHSITNNADLEDVIPSISGPYNLSEDHNSMSSITKSSGKVSPKICSKRSTSPMGTVKRRSWTITEREVVFRLFEENITSGKLPSLSKCQDAILCNEGLQNRSPSQLKTWLHNQMKNKKSISYRVGHLLQFSLHVHQTRSTKLFFF